MQIKALTAFIVGVMVMGFFATHVLIEIIRENNRLQEEITQLEIEE